MKPLPKEIGELIIKAPYWIRNPQIEYQVIYEKFYERLSKYRYKELKNQLNKAVAIVMALPEIGDALAVLHDGNRVTTRLVIRTCPGKPLYHVISKDHSREALILINLACLHALKDKCNSFNKDDSFNYVFEDIVEQYSNELIKQVAIDRNYF